MPMFNPIPRVAAIHDLSGFGRASLTVIIPILSTMGVQVCPLPTAVLSTHTGGFTGYRMVDLTDSMESFIEHWEALNLSFDAVYSGFLGSPLQIDIVKNFIRRFSKGEKSETPLVVVDPVMGDDGTLYGPIGEKMVKEMRQHITNAHIITPNFTEAAFLLDKEYSNSTTQQQIKDWILELSQRGPRIVIITSVPLSRHENVTSVVAYDQNDGRFWRVNCNFIPAYYPGTGDIFTSVVVGSILQGDSLPIALDRAVQFVSIAIRATFGHSYPKREGVLLEKVLPNLRAPVVTSTYELLE